MLMVRHVHDKRDYWTFPGGGVEEGESILEAAKREVLEETGIKVEPLDVIHSFQSDGNESHCVLMSSPTELVEPSIGHDPEEAHLPRNEQMLREVAWRLIDEISPHPIIARVLDKARSW